MKDVEKSLLGNTEAYGSFKIKIESLPGNVVVIASHTQVDDQKEKVSYYTHLSLLEKILWVRGSGSGIDDVWFAINFPVS